MREITLAFTGASGAPYGWRLLELLLQQDIRVHLLISSAARVVFATEHNIKLAAAPEKCTAQIQAQFACKTGQLTVYGKDDWFSPVASGSAAPRHMVICPCSTGAVSAIACGASNNLIERAADVVIKEGGKLILVPRESPLSAIHLENLLKLARLGVTIMPAAPGFYHQPQQISDLVDFMVARILDQLGVSQQLTARWGYGGERSLNSNKTGERE
ncbi:aromatic acid decarboxylase [Arsukibacterium sp. MJ3]|uniref:flavin prenyltransferase UbiX n=1 Tax=Arsukibacterium sp. MJ3 TaxID=1632859 RepID=UPI00062713CA|nr:flavin prenyltransferase UbiX [Arsukibacterium sp. MJ3]KKO48615.1 aromatic acid decarboxylase [Arsukibacterium sp. MJ3]